MQFQLGRLPNDPAKPRLRLANYTLEAVSAPPDVKDWLSAVNSWEMFGNDQYGDCTCAAAAHIIEALSTYGQGLTSRPTLEDVYQAYHDVTGWNPDYPSTDQGAVMQDVLDYWRKTGIAGHKILAFAQVDHTDPTSVRQAISIFGTVYMGFNFPASAMRQFNAGLVWDAVPQSYIEGGHAVNVGSYTTDGLTCVTWGRLQGMTQAFWDKYVDEAWVVIAPEWLSAAGLSPEGLDLYGLGEDFSALTGEPDPFPEPPRPQPIPMEQADNTLETALRAWLNSDPYFYKSVQAAAVAWLDNRSLM